MNENQMNEIENHLLKADDWWGKHNITTRFIVLANTLMLIGLVFFQLMTDRNIPHFNDMLNVIGDIVLYTTIIIILGVNGIKVFLNFKKNGFSFNNSQSSSNPNTTGNDLTNPKF